MANELTRQQEIDELCALYDKHVLAHELMIAYDQLALYQEEIFKLHGMAFKNKEQIQQ